MTLLTVSHGITNFMMIFLYEYIPTVLTIPTAYCMETEFEELRKLGLDLVYAEKKLLAALDLAVIV
jgi:hypothetical protein